jgi:hypothetical protein
VFLSVLLEHMARLADQMQGVASEAYGDLSIALTVPLHISAIDNTGASSTPLIDVWMYWPTTLLTLVVLVACGMTAWRAARLTGVGPWAGLGVAAAFATLITILIYVAGAYARIATMLGNPFGAVARYTPVTTVDPEQSWAHAFAWALVPALLGAGAGRAALNLVRFRWRTSTLNHWRAALVGALWASAACLALCGLATFITMLVWVNSTPLLTTNSSRILAGFLITAPLWCIFPLVVGVGASLQGSIDLGDGGGTHAASANLLGHWPLTDWAYVLPLLVVMSFVIGATRALALHRSRAVVFTMIPPFALLNVGLAWLGGVAASVRVNQDFINQLSQTFTSLGLSTRNPVVTAMTGSGVTLRYGPALLEVVPGSVVTGLIAAALVFFWLGPEFAEPATVAASPGGSGDDSPGRRCFWPFHRGGCRVFRYRTWLLVGSNGEKYWCR